MRSNILSLISNLQVIVSGDGQSDSPGHSAKYLTYFVMLSDDLEDFIVHLECTDKREVGGKSPCMKKEALKCAVQKLKDLIKLKEVVTDASSSIIKMMGNLSSYSISSRICGIIFTGNTSNENCQKLGYFLRHFSGLFNVNSV